VRCVGRWVGKDEGVGHGLRFESHVEGVFDFDFGLESSEFYAFREVWIGCVIGHVFRERARTDFEDGGEDCGICVGMESDNAGPRVFARIFGRVWDEDGVDGCALPDGESGTGVISADALHGDSRCCDLRYVRWPALAVFVGEDGVVFVLAVYGVSRKRVADGPCARGAFCGDDGDVWGALSVEGAC